MQNQKGTMMRRWAIAGFAAAAAGVVLVASAWACVPVATLNATPSAAKPGETVTFSGASYNSPKPVVFHWGAIDGPVLTQVTPEGGVIRGSFVIPADAKAGNYVVVATQEAVPGTQTWGVPARVLISVGADTPVLGANLGAQVTDRPVGLVTHNSVSGGSLLLMALGAAGVAMMVAGVAAVLAGRRPASAPTAQAVKN